MMRAFFGGNCIFNDTSLKLGTQLPVIVCSVVVVFFYIGSFYISLATKIATNFIDLY